MRKGRTSVVEQRRSQQEEVPQLQELFRLCFGDGPAYSDQFFNYFYRPEEFLVLREEGQLRAMGGLLPLTLTEPDGRQVKAAYLYALATHPDHQGKGYARTLLTYAHFYLRGKRDCLLSVPARPDLHPFFQKMGFAECFPVLEGELLPPAASTEEGQARALDGAAYDALRESLLAGTHHVSYGPFAGLQKRLCDLSGGALLALELPEGPGCAAVEHWEGTAFIKELICPPQAVSSALALIARTVPAGHYLLRAPVRPGAPDALVSRPFGMVIWYDPIAARRWEGAGAPYLGLAFD